MHWGRFRKGAALVAYPPHTMTLNVYVDAFNLYYGCLKGTPYRWLDIASMCRLAFPSDTVQRIRVFTARVKPTPDDPSQHTRQSAYLPTLTDKTGTIRKPDPW